MVVAATVAGLFVETVHFVAFVGSVAFAFDVAMECRADVGSSAVGVVALVAGAASVLVAGPSAVVFGLAVEVDQSGVVSAPVQAAGQVGVGLELAVGQFGVEFELASAVGQFDAEFELAVVLGLAAYLIVDVESVGQADFVLVVVDQVEDDQPAVGPS